MNDDCCFLSSNFPWLCFSMLMSIVLTLCTMYCRYMEKIVGTPSMDVLVRKPDLLSFHVSVRFPYLSQQGRNFWKLMESRIDCAVKSSYLRILTVSDVKVFRL